VRQVHALWLVVSMAAVAAAAAPTESWEDLAKLGATPPTQYDARAARRVIVAALEAGAVAQEDWWTANGLWGASRLPASSPEGACARVGYRSLFGSAFAADANSKLERIATGPDVDTLLAAANAGSKCVIFQRESGLAALGYYLNARFQTDARGSFGRILTQNREHPADRELTKVLGGAYALYSRLEARGFDDKTLGDAIGFAQAFLEYDGIGAYESGIRESVYLPATAQSYRDAVKAMIEQMRRGRSFFDALGREMAASGFHRLDVIAEAADPAAQKALIKIVREDLDGLERLAQAPAP